MGIGIDVAVQGMALKERELELIANNLSNSNTAGFREQRIAFESSLLKQQTDARGVTEKIYFPEATSLTSFVPGAYLSTGNSLDVAIQGEGFFEVQTDQGAFYTRNGALSLDAQGRLVTSTGASIMGAEGNLEIKTPGKIQISSKGDITNNGESVGRLKVVRFQNLKNLKPVGNNLYTTIDSPETLESPSVLQGRIEGSNATLVQNLGKMIEVSRQYETYQRVIKTHERMDQEIASSLGRLS